MRFIAFKQERFTHINKEVGTPLFDVKLDKIEDACMLFCSNLENIMMKTNFNLSQCSNDLRDKGFYCTSLNNTIAEKRKIITYVIIEYDFVFKRNIHELFDSKLYNNFTRKANKIIRESKIKTILDD